MEFSTVRLEDLGVTDVYGQTLVVGRKLFNGAVWYDTDHDDKPCLMAQLMIAPAEMDSSDINDFRAYVKPIKDSFINVVATLNNMADALVDCESLNQQDRYLVKTCGYERQV
jgi:hypothetical protein